eukprot:scaffold3732_cov144-Chaetoceros_neogracile.AAC.2
MQSQNANKTASGKKRNVDDLQIADLSNMHYHRARHYLKERNLVPKEGPGCHKQNLATLTALLNDKQVSKDSDDDSNGSDEDDNASGVTKRTAKDDGAKDDSDEDDNASGVTKRTAKDDGAKDDSDEDDNASGVTKRTAKDDGAKDDSDEDDNASGVTKRTAKDDGAKDDGATDGEVGCGRVPSMGEVKETHKFLLELKAEMELYEANAYAVNSAKADLSAVVRGYQKIARLSGARIQQMVPLDMNGKLFEGATNFVRTHTGKQKDMLNKYKGKVNAPSLFAWKWITGAINVDSFEAEAKEARDAWISKE